MQKDIPNLFQEYRLTFYKGLFSKYVLLSCSFNLWINFFIFLFIVCNKQIPCYRREGTIKRLRNYMLSLSISWDNVNLKKNPKKSICFLNWELSSGIDILFLNMSKWIFVCVAAVTLSSVLTGSDGNI